MLPLRSERASEVESASDVCDEDGDCEASGVEFLQFLQTTAAGEVNRERRQNFTPGAAAGRGHHRVFTADELNCRGESREMTPSLLQISDDTVDDKLFSLEHAKNRQARIMQRNQHKRKKHPHQGHPASKGSESHSGESHGGETSELDGEVEENHPPGTVSDSGESHHGDDGLKGHHESDHANGSEPEGDGAHEVDELEGGLDEAPNPYHYALIGGIAGAFVAFFIGSMIGGDTYVWRFGLLVTVVGFVVGGVAGLLSSGVTAHELQMGVPSHELAEPYTEKLHQISVTVMAIATQMANSPEDLYNESQKAAVDLDLSKVKTLIAHIEKEIAQGLHATKAEFHEIEEILTHGRYSQFLSAEAASANEEVVTANDASLIEAGDDLSAAEHAEDTGPAGHLDSYEGDMVPADDDQLLLFQAITRGSVNGTGHATMADLRRAAGPAWTDATIYYCFASDVPPAVQHIVQAAIKDFENAVPCLKFIDAGWQSGTSADKRKAQNCGHSPAIFVQSNPNEGCYSYVGMVGGWNSQKLQLQNPGCTQIGTAVHEFGHALGMAHEQARSDRDSFVKIDWGNIQAGMEYNFDMNNKEHTASGYDFLSVMHYDAFAFAANRKKPTIIDKAHPAHSANEEGQRIGLANSDILQLGDQYKDASKRKCDANPVSGLGCIDKPNSDGSNPCAGVDACSASNIQQCCGCGGGVQVQCYANSDCPGADPLPAPDGAECIVDKSKLFPEGSGCVFKNRCDFPVKWKCPGLKCTHDTEKGGFWNTDCGGTPQTDICIPGKCDVWQA